LNSNCKQMKTCLLIFITLCMLSCARKPVSYTENLGGREFIIKDSISTITIGHCDITECLDAEILSGKLYFPEKIFQQIKSKYLKDDGLTAYQHDIYLTGKDNITYKLFDSVLSPKMGNKYRVTGKVVGFKGYGAVFKIDSYQLLAETSPSVRRKGKTLADAFPVENIVSVKITNIHGRHHLTSKEMSEFKKQLGAASYSGGLLEKPGHIFLEFTLKNTGGSRTTNVYASNNYIHFDKSFGRDNAEFSGSYKLTAGFDFDQYK